MTVAGRFRLSVLLSAGLLAAFVAVGLLGVERYASNYWLFRGFAPPRDPAFVRVGGTQQELHVRSPALGGRSQQVYVFLPPGYQSSTQRYPVLYLLHGFPGRPLAFLETVDMGVVEDELTARGGRPAILVMPFGSTGTFTDKEWVDGVGRGQGWGTFVARDLVRTIDRRYRTIPSAQGRAIAGLSEGGFGAIDIALRHPDEFSVVESWSGYERPDPIRSIYGSHFQLVKANDPRRTLRRVAPELRRLHTYFWFYSGTSDRLRRQNEAFAAELGSLGVAHHYFEPFGGHNWALWRQNAQGAYVAAVSHLVHA
jgi:enterochelin esterase-like enzyme